MSFEMTLEDLAEMIFLNGIATRAAYAHRKYNQRSLLPQMPFAENAFVRQLRNVKPERNQSYSEYLPALTYFPSCVIIAMKWNKQNDSALTDQEIEAVNDGTMFSKNGILGAFLAHDWYRETTNSKQPKIVTPLDYYSWRENMELMEIFSFLGNSALLELSKLLFGKEESKLDNFLSLMLFFIWEAIEELWPSVYSFTAGVDYEDVVPDEPGSQWQIISRRLHAITYAESVIRFLIFLFRGQLEFNNEALRSLFELIYPNTSPQMQNFEILFEEEFLRRYLKVERRLLINSPLAIQAPYFFASNVLRGPFPVYPLFPAE